MASGRRKKKRDSINNLHRQVPGGIPEENLGAINPGGSLLTRRVGQWLTQNYYQLGVLYASDGLIRNIIEAPVLAALSMLPEILTNDMEAEEIENKKRQLKKMKALRITQEALIYCRLYGGAGALLLNDQAPEKMIKAPRPGIQYIRALMPSELTDVKGKWRLRTPRGDYSIHPDRLVILRQGIVPAGLSGLTGGWGFSVLEAVDAALTAYAGFIADVKKASEKSSLDVLSLASLDSVVDSAGKSDLKKAITRISASINSANLIAIGSEDKYEHITRDISHLGELYNVIKQALVAALGIRPYILFGESSAGFQSNQHEMDSYDLLLRGIRAQAGDILERLIDIEIGDENKFYELNWEAPSATIEREKAETAAVTAENILKLYEAGIVSAQESQEIINLSEVFPVKLTGGEDEY